MAQLFKVNNVDIAYHPAGYRIDKTASAINCNTRWLIQPDGTWRNMKPVCFHALPENGWIKVDAFSWNPSENHGSFFEEEVTHASR